MNSNVLVPAVYITNSYDDIKNNFLSKKQGDTLSLNLKTTETSLLITPSDNRYLESFEYSFNYEKQDKDTLVLRILDTDGEFEKRFIGFNLQRYQEKVINDLKNEQNRLRSTKASESLGEAGLTLTRFSELANKPNTIYVAFGTGTDFVNWSNPSVFILAKAQIDVTPNNIRRYILTFFPSYDSLFRPKLIFNLDKPNPDSEFFYTKSLQKITAPLQIGKRPESNNDTLSKIIYKLLKNYISSITGVDEKNIIAIIPELDVKSVEDIPGRLDLEKVIDLELLKETGIKLISNPKNSLDFNSMQQVTKGLSPSPGVVGAAANQALRDSGNNEYYYVIESEPIDSQLNPRFPNFYKPLNDLSIFIKNKLKTTDYLTILEENDSRILEFFYSEALISNPKERCIIVGLEKMISNYLYADLNVGPDLQSDVNNVIDNLRNSQKFNLPILKYTKTSEKTQTITDEILDIPEPFILTNIYRRFDPPKSNDGLSPPPLYESYSKNFINFKSRNKNTSNFSEVINIDELAIDNFGKQFSESFKSSEVKKLFETLEIPVFTLNMVNSNILDLQLLNSENYLQGLNLSVRSNAAKFFLSQVNKNLNLLGLRSISIDSIQNKASRALLELIEDTEISNIIEELSEFGAFEEGVDIVTTTGISNSLIGLGNLQSPLKPSTTKKLKPSELAKKFKYILGKVLTEQFFLYKNLEKLQEPASWLESEGFYKTEEEYENARLNELNVIDKLATLRYYTKEQLWWDTPYSPSQNFPEEVNGQYYTTQKGKLIEIYKKRASLVEKLLRNQKIKDLLTGYENLLISNKGNIDLDAVLFNYAIASQENIGEARVTGFRITSVDSGSGGGISRVNYSKDRELIEKFFEYSITLTSLFDIEDIQDPMNIGNIKGLQFVPKRFGLEQDNIVAELFAAMTQQPWKVSIKTLPFFYLSNIRSMAFKPCFLFSKKPNLFGTSNSTKMDFFSGMYNIVSFKHVITTKEAYSQFILLKKAANSALI